MKKTMLLFPMLLLFVFSLVTGCSNNDGSGALVAGGTAPDTLDVEIVASGLNQPVYLTTPAGDSRLFVVEQAGMVRIIKDGELLTTPFLDITDRVLSGGERGLFSIAFHPEYASNGFIYVSYTDLDGNTQVDRYTVTSDPDVADPDSMSPILSLTQPFNNHNGGLVVFGPDGMLYLGFGDGGGAGDPIGNGQNPETLLGTILRIDINVDDNAPYAIPPDNPFVDIPAARDEIWAIGLRNPWRFSFDSETNLLYIADPGQDSFEEINVEPSNQGGLNYGWNIMEGRQCFDPPIDCDQTDLILPKLVYGQSEGCAVIGGHVYRGTSIPDLQGHYLYSDFCSGFLKSFRFENGVMQDERQWDVPIAGNITSFGLDATGEIYILSAGGDVYRLIP